MVMLTGYLQSRQAQKRTPAVNKQMAIITKVMPVFFGFISLNFPAGLVLYFFVSNSWRLGQQEVIFRRIGTAANPKHKSLMNPPKAGVVDAESREREGSVDVIDEPAELESGETKPTTAAKPAPKTNPKAVPKGTTAKGTSAVQRQEHQRESGSDSGRAAAPRWWGNSFPVQAASPAGGSPEAGSARQQVEESSPRRSRRPRRARSSGARPGQDGRRTSKKKKKR